MAISLTMELKKQREEPASGVVNRTAAPTVPYHIRETDFENGNMVAVPDVSHHTATCIFQTSGCKLQLHQKCIKPKNGRNFK